jgi:hypothetical protein
MCKRNCYLNEALAQFPAVAKRRFKRTVDLATIETAFNGIENSTHITKKALALIVGDSSWDPLEFSFPRLQAWTDRLQSGPPLPLKFDAPSVQILGDLAKRSGSLQNASVLLRFVDPENHFILAGYLSPFSRFFPGPLDYGASELNAYFALRNDLRSLGMAHGISRVADVDMALWAIWILQRDGNGAGAGIVARYHQDKMIQSWRADRADIPSILKNIDETLNLFGLLDMANYFNSFNPRIAGILAGVAFESLIQEHPENKARHSSMNSQIESIYVAESKRDTAGTCWGTRNTCVHAAAFEKFRGLQPHDFALELRSRVASMIQFVRDESTSPEGK